LNGACRPPDTESLDQRFIVQFREPETPEAGEISKLFILIRIHEVATECDKARQPLFGAAGFQMHRMTHPQMLGHSNQQRQQQGLATAF
jgi:hypothetical protein